MTEETNEAIEEENAAGQEVSATVQTENTETTDPYEEDLNLSKGVSLSPRNEDEADMRNIHPEGWDVYLRSSDDAGELLGDEELEQRVKDTCARFENLEGQGQEVEGREQLIDEIHKLSDLYDIKIDASEAYSDATIIKYRLRWGKLLNCEKMLVKQYGTRWEKSWIKYFHEKYSPAKQRSANVYMKLGRIPNIIGYAFLGYDLLNFVASQISEANDENPVGNWLQENGIVFNPSNPDDTEECFTKIKSLATHHLLEDQGHNNIDKEHIEQLVRMKVKIEKHLKNLNLLKNYSNDPAAVQQYLDKLVQNQGEVEPSSDLTNFSRKDSFNRSASAVSEAAEKYLNGEWDIASVDATQVISLKEKMTALSAMVAEQE